MQIPIKLLPVIALVTILIPAFIACTETQHQPGQPTPTATVTATPKPGSLIPTSAPTPQITVPSGGPIAQLIFGPGGAFPSSAEIPPGSYVSDAYLGSRTLAVQGKVLTMSCQAKTGNIEDFPLLGTHTYQYFLYGVLRDTHPTLDNSKGIYLKDVVSGIEYVATFKNVGNYGIIVLGGDYYRIK